MIVATLLWATAGVMARQITHASGIQITFGRSFFACLSTLLLLRIWRGPNFFRRIQWREPLLWISSACWAVMFTAFMLALSFTTVANVLVLSALTPVFTALVGRFWLRHKLPQRTWITIMVAALGVIYIYAAHFTLGNERKFLGSAIALLVPLAACLQWTLMHREQSRRSSCAEKNPQESVKVRDLIPAVAIGGGMSALICLPFIWPLNCTLSDVGWMAALGMFQLALPSSLAVVASRVLHGPEMALLALLEILFGIALTWWGAGEVPGPNVLIGGSLVVVALATNEWLGWRQQHITKPSTS
ncbi:MAG: DMT family transporter [Brachymonas sp.]